MPIKTDYEVKNLREFRKVLQAAGGIVQDLRFPFKQISGDFYKSEKSIFQLKGPGRYKDITPQTKTQKLREVGFIYPILKRTRRLEKSVTSPRTKDSILKIGKKELIIGTKVPYAAFHQEGTKRMPRRPFFFIGPEAPRFATRRQQGRLERWTSILEAFVAKKLEQESNR